jgi:sugar transferase (PEP-CTERM/EpsH1 system associated)
MAGLLYLCHRIPYPPNKGDKIRSYHLLRYLAKRFEVHLGAFVDDEADWAHLPALREMCADVHLCRLSARSARLRSLTALLTGEPLTLPYYRDVGLARWVRGKLADGSIGHAVVFSSAMAQYLEDRSVRRVIDFVDVDSDKWTQYARTVGWPMRNVYAREGRKLLAYEKRIAASFDASFFVSRAEAELFHALAPAQADRVGYFNNGVDAAYFDPGHASVSPYPSEVLPIVFTGAMDYWPNVDAVSWFATDVFPHIRQAHPRARFYIVGSRPTPAVKALAAEPGVEVTGTVPDVRPYVAHAAVAVAPLRIARGVQNKVLEAMAMARPVVVSPAALEGIEAQAGKELLLAASGPEFAAQVGKVLAGEAGAVGAAARERVLRDYGWDDNLARVGETLDGGSSRSRPSRTSGAQGHALGLGASA